MARMRLLTVAGMACALALLVLPVKAQTGTAAKPQTGAAAKPQTGTAAKSETSAGSLGSVSIPKKVMANGQPLAAGTYTVRMSSDSVSPVVGESADSEKWVEFVQGGQVKGKELATVVTGADAKSVLKGKAPAAGSARVDELKGADYLRVWINKGATTYLIHLTLATS